jgi:hypothetical protein
MSDNQVGWTIGVDSIVPTPGSPSVAESLAAIAFELKRMNDRAADGGPEAETPEEATGCRICGHPDAAFFCSSGTTLTRDQWFKHHDHEYYESQDMGANKTDAVHYADSQMAKRYGAEPPREEATEMET